MKSIVATIFLLAIPTVVHAEGEFTTSVSTEYEIKPTGITHVRKTFQLKNNVSSIYAKRYGLEVSTNRLQNISVTDKNGKLNANIVQTDNSTSIGIDFEDKVVGKDQIREFTINYDDPDVAILTGKILEVRIPGLADPEVFENYEVIIIVPEGFSTPAIASPEEYEVQAGTQTKIIYRDSSSEGISLIFGEEQSYDFSLTYHLLNPSGSRGITQVALPPDTSYQRVTFKEISPRPEKIEQDEDGNWIATYILESKQEQTVVATGLVHVFLTPQPDFPQKLPSPELLQEDTHWQVNDPQIKQLAEQYKTPKEIYDFVISTLEYNYERLEPDSEPVRLGAVTALSQPNNAVCQEFTDLFIALARANGIPARQAVGYAFTQNPQIRPLSLVQDILHAWPEYYDAEKAMWIPVDPTWGDTTGGVDYFSQFDFSHVVFAIQGHSSEKPYPAGSYKRADVATRDVKIEPSIEKTSNISKYELSLNQVPKQFTWRSHIDMTVQNATGRAWYNIPVQIRLPNNINSSQLPTNIEKILPYQTKSLTFLLSTTELFQAKQGTFFAQVGDQSLQEEIVVAPEIFQFLGKIGYASMGQIGLMIVGILCGAFALIFIINMFRRKKAL